MFYPWLIVAIVVFATLAYVIGRWNDIEQDTAGLLTTSFFVSIFWPVVLAAVVVFGPFVGLYAYGVRKRNIEAEKLKAKKLELVK